MSFHAHIRRRARRRTGDTPGTDDPAGFSRARDVGEFVPIPWQLVMMEPPPPRFFDLNGDGVREMLVAHHAGPQRRCADAADGGDAAPLRGCRSSIPDVTTTCDDDDATSRRFRKLSRSTLGSFHARAALLEAPRSSDPLSRRLARAFMGRRQNVRRNRCPRSNTRISGEKARVAGAAGHPMRSPIGVAGSILTTGGPVLGASQSARAKRGFWNERP